MRLLSVSLLLAACTGRADDTAADDTAAEAADPSVVLLELAIVSCTDLYLAVHYSVGDPLLSQMEDGDEMSGSLAFPADADPEYWRVEGTLGLDWAVTHRVDAFDEVRSWDWMIALDIASLTLPSAEVAGAAAWAVTYESYDSRYEYHDWEGDLSIDGAEAVAAAWTGHGTYSALNGMEGTIDGEAVAWENEDPDLP